MRTPSTHDTCTLARRLAGTAGVLACALALGLAVAPSSFAASPEFLHFSGSFTETSTEVCGFPITNDEAFSTDVQIYYDKDGNPDHSIAHIQLRGTDSANGVSLVDDADWTHTYDFTTGVDADTGLIGRVLLPNGGALAIEAGRVLSLDDGTVLFVAGRHDFMSGNLAAFCAALGG